MAYKYKALDYEKAYNDAYLALQQAKNAAEAQQNLLELQYRYDALAAAM